MWEYQALSRLFTLLVAAAGLGGHRLSCPIIWGLVITSFLSKPKSQTLLLAHLLQTLFETLTCLMVESTITRDGEPQMSFESMESQLWGGRRKRGHGSPWRYAVLIVGAQKRLCLDGHFLGRALDSGVLRTRFESDRCYLWVVSPWESYLSSLSFGFSIHKMGISWSVGGKLREERTMEAWHPKGLSV